MGKGQERWIMGLETLTFFGDLTKKQHIQIKILIKGQNDVGNRLTLLITL